jgi:hypothetical protein
MKKEKRVEFGIEITKPWSAEMYNHNEEVAEVVRFEVKELLDAALCNFLEGFHQTEDPMTLPWNFASADLVDIQTAVTCYGFGLGYDIEQVIDQVEQELETAPLYRLNEIAEELGLELEKGFVGFS